WSARRVSSSDDSSPVAASAHNSSNVSCFSIDSTSTNNCSFFFGGPGLFLSWTVFQYESTQTGESAIVMVSYVDERLTGFGGNLPEGHPFEVGHLERPS